MLIRVANFGIILHIESCDIRITTDFKFSKFCLTVSHCVSLCLTLYQRRHFSAFSLCLTLVPKTTVETPKIGPKIFSGVEIGYKNS